MFCAAMSVAMVTRLLRPFNCRWMQVDAVLDRTGVFDTKGDRRSLPESTLKSLFFAGHLFGCSDIGPNVCTITKKKKVRECFKSSLQNHVQKG